MKTILFTLGLFFAPLTFSQNSEVYNSEWYSSLDESINFIAFKEPCETKIQFRVYRGDDITYKVTITNCKGNIIRQEQLNPIDEIDVSNVYSGVYYITAEDSEGNKITKEFIIGS